MNYLLEIIRRIRTRDWFLEMFVVFIGGHAFLYLIWATLTFQDVPLTGLIYFTLAVCGITIYVTIIILGLFTALRIRK